ncbi:MAG: NRDE family protein [Desulfopila sp.]
MCIVLFSYKHTPGYHLVVAANRDEFLIRPTAPLAWWDDGAKILAGRDLQDGGTWLGVNASGKFGALTNYREMVHGGDTTVSRGEILPRYFGTAKDATHYPAELERWRNRYRGFNVVLGDGDALVYYSNRADRQAHSGSQLQPGIYGLSNHLLDSPWPKLQRAKDLFHQALTRRPFSVESLFGFLRDTWQPPRHSLPDTGIGPLWEKKLAPIFISSDNYGTRSSSVVTISDAGQTTVCERTFHHKPDGVKTEAQRCFTI